MEHQDLVVALEARGLPSSFLKTSFTLWTTAELRLIIDVLNTHHVRESANDKLTLCTTLLSLKPGKLNHYEQAGVGFALAGGSLEDSRAIVRGIGNESVGVRTLGPAESTLKRRLRECQSCFDEVPESDFPNVPIGAPICHDPFTICSDCLSAHIESRTKSTQLDQIPCPEADCDAVIDHALMMKYAPASAFQRYEDALNKKTLNDMSDFIFCSNEVCDYAGTVDLYLVSYITCPECGTRTCTACRTNWHPGITHEQNTQNVQREAQEFDRGLLEAAERASEEIKSSAYLSEHTKACPGPDCGARLQKRGGCDHMTCKRCQHQFCWLCLQAYGPILREGNHMHATDCSHFRDQTRQTTQAHPHQPLQTVAPPPGLDTFPLIPRRHRLPADDGLSDSGSSSTSSDEEDPPRRPVRPQFYDSGESSSESESESETESSSDSGSDSDAEMGDADTHHHRTRPDNGLEDSSSESESDSSDDESHSPGPEQPIGMQVLDVTSSESESDSSDEDIRLPNLPRRNERSEDSTSESNSDSSDEEVRRPCPGVAQMNLEDSSSDSDSSDD